MDCETKSVIIEKIEEMITINAPDATMRSMYGGTVIETVSGNPKTRIGGFYEYDAYVSLEFANGVLLNDPNGFLEGSGKKRRHLKLRSLGDIDEKNCIDIFCQALSYQYA